MYTVIVFFKASVILFKEKISTTSLNDLKLKVSSQGQRFFLLRIQIISESSKG